MIIRVAFFFSEAGVQRERHLTLVHAVFLLCWVFFFNEKNGLVENLWSTGVVIGSRDITFRKYSKIDNVAVDELNLPFFFPITRTYHVFNRTSVSRFLSYERTAFFLKSYHTNVTRFFFLWCVFRRPESVRPSFLLSFAPYARPCCAC